MEDKDYPLLTPVKRAEDDARSLVVDAETQAKNEIRAARERAEEMVKTAESNARDEVRQKVEDARYIGEEEAQDILERNQSEIEAMKKRARPRLTDAGRVVVERVTGGTKKTNA